MTNAAIRTSNLTKRYGNELAVDDLSLSISPGTVYGFLGPNGAGKTTTMRMLTSLTKPTTGTASVAGAPITDRGRITECIGYLSADPPVFEELSGYEQIRYAARLHELPEQTASEKTAALLNRFDLNEDAHRRIASYSTGMRKKIGIIQAVIHEPDVVFLDEPTSGLDPRAARTVRDTISELTTREMTVFLSTHILPVVDELADTVGVIDDGELVAEGSPTALKRQVASEDDADLEAAFLDITRESDIAGEASE